MIREAGIGCRAPESNEPKRLDGGTGRPVSLPEFTNRLSMKPATVDLETTEGDGAKYNGRGWS